MTSGEDVLPSLQTCLWLSARTYEGLGHTCLGDSYTYQGLQHIPWAGGLEHIKDCKTYQGSNTYQGLERFAFCFVIL